MAWKGLRFGTKVYLLITLLVVVVMAAAASLFLYTQSRAMEEELNKRGSSLIESLAQGVRLGLVLEDQGFISQATAGVLGLPDLLFADFYRADGTLLLKLGGAVHAADLAAADFQAAAANGLQTMSGRIRTAGDGEGYRAFLTPVHLEDQDLAGYIRLGLSTQGIREKWQASLQITAAATLVLIGLSCLVAVFLVRRITHPLRQLSAGAVRIGGGMLDFDISVQSHDELGELAENFNNMAASLRRHNEEIQRKNEAIEASERKYRQLFEQIAEALYICDMDGRLLDCNQAMVDMFGYASREEMIASVRMGADLYADPGKRPEVVAEALGSGGVKAREVEFKKKDGTVIHGLVTSNLRRDDDGQPVGFEGLIQDVTELRQLEAQLVQSQKMEAIGTLAGGIAHDFNNLLAVIMASAEMALMGTDADDPKREKLERIIKAGNRAAELTKNLLGFARKGKMRIEEIDVDHLIGEVTTLLSETIDRSIAIETDIAADLWPVSGDPGQIHQILINLCVNARDAMLPMGRGRLRLGARNVVIDHEFVAAHPQTSEGHYVLIEVKDTGPGIPKAMHDRIFEPFFTTKEVGKGTGLGLATAYGIVKNHDGFMLLDSEEGRGAAFSIYLPAYGKMDAVVSDKDMAPAITEAPASRVEAGEGETVLVVDDEESLRQITRAFLERSGYRVLMAINGREALQRLQEQEGHVHLVLLDLVMPVMSGQEVLQYLNRHYPGLPVIVMSGHAREVLQRQLPGQSYAGFLAKPYRLSVLLREVRRVLHKTAALT